MKDYGPKPDLDPPRDCRWVSEWRRAETWDTSMKPYERRPVWIREYLELDGHEDCCHHVWPMIVEVPA